MNIRLKDHLDDTTFLRGHDYAQRGHVVSVEPVDAGALRARVSSGRGDNYQQRIVLSPDLVDGICSCPVGHNCKHVVAALVVWAERQNGRQGLAPPVQGWLARVKECASMKQQPEPRPKDYPANAKDRLLYVLMPYGSQAKIDIFKGRSNAAGTGLNKPSAAMMRCMPSAAPPRTSRRCGSHFGHIVHAEDKLVHCFNGASFRFNSPA